MKKKPEKYLELYQFEGCPYCHRAREKLSEMELTYIIHTVPQAQSERTELIKITGGPAGVPTLVDPNTNTVIADDDDKIIEYLEQQYAE
ncbi:hypothetical protein BK004_01825 [bacterium CG10_46_32]|nr:MAG: hypothetical protein BK004_01825 [bacterium CG10_46_32]PIR56174.1 MAG: glutaredoxin [Parcubacteria group bacterium CG10_big_fil_rev_8_21_14_0_10_46_32]